MGRNSALDHLTPEQRTAVESCIRQHYYVRNTEVSQSLAAQGIHLTRSTVNRIAMRLREKDGNRSGCDDDTVVVIMERSTGATSIATTSASRDSVLASIPGLSTPS
jgi:arginine repressor